jgi:hypothetical protein
MLSSVQTSGPKGGGALCITRGSEEQVAMQPPVRIARHVTLGCPLDISARSSMTVARI